MPKITKRAVDASYPDSGGKRYFVWDSEIKGFGLLVLPSGVKSYVFNYRTPEGRSRRYTIGKHGTWTPEQARRKASELRHALSIGDDPLAAKAAKRSTKTVGEILDAYLASERFQEKAESTKAIDRGRISRHLRPLLGSRYVSDFKTEDIRRALSDIRDGKTAATIKTGKRGLARVRGGKTTARDSIALLRAMLNWAVAEELITNNPAASVKLGANGTRDLILNDAQDYARLFSTLERMENEKRLRQPVADAIRVIALTGARRGEIAGLRWEHVDLKRGLITLPIGAHKTGGRTGKPRVIGLPTMAQEIIARQGTGESGDFVFAPSRGNGPIELSRVWRKIREEASLPEGIGLHGLRHSLASHMAMGGAGAAEIMTALGHTQIATAARYVHWAQDARQGLAEQAASVVMAGFKAEDGAASGKVARLPERKKQ